MADRYVAVHEKPNGPGDARPTAVQIIKDEGLEGKWAGKVVLITGCSSGLGVETAKAIYLTGATLYLTARNLEKAKTALGDLAKSDRVHLLKADLESLASMRECAEEFLKQSKTLNVLIANAGVMATPEGRTKDGFETQFGTNHLAHFLLINLLLPTIASSSSPSFNSRVVLLSSVGHRASEVDFDNLNFEGKYNPFAAYGQSKTANIWTANQIDRLYGSKGVHALSVHPGGINTGITQHLPEEAVAGLANNPDLVSTFKSPEQGASTSVWAATAAALDGVGAKYLEDAHIGEEYDPASGMWGPGYASWAFSPEKEEKLWSKSLELVGLKK